MRKTSLRIIAALLLIAAIGAGYWYSRPVIEEIEPNVFEPGQELSVHGRNFSILNSKPEISFDGVPLPRYDYTVISDTLIKVKVPATADSGILRVRSNLGWSNPRIVIAREALPQQAAQVSAQSIGPEISGIKPEEARIGDLIEISGLNFGTSTAFSTVSFPDSSPELPAGMSAPGLREAVSGLAANQNLAELWDDKTILMRIPDFAGSGSVTVHTPQGNSNPVFLRIRQGSGSRTLQNPVIYAVRQKVKIQSRNAKSGDQIMIFLPKPALSAFQRPSAVQESDTSAMPAETGGGVQSPVRKISDSAASYSIFEINPAASTEVTAEQKFLVAVYAVETDLTGYRDGFGTGGAPAYLQDYLKPDGLVPAGVTNLVDTAKKIIGQEKNLQKKAILLWNWAQKNINYMPEKEKPMWPLANSAASAFAAKKAGTRSFVLIVSALFRAAGIPAVPVSGFLVRQDNVTIPHFWLEYYLPAVGWIPADPVLAMGKTPTGFIPEFQASSHYFGALDNRHIAISRGLPEAVSADPAERNVQNKALWSFQNIFETSRSVNYESFWFDLEITGRY